MSFLSKLGSDIGESSGFRLRRSIVEFIEKSPIIKEFGKKSLVDRDFNREDFNSVVPGFKNFVTEKAGRHFDFKTIDDDVYEEYCNKLLNIINVSDLEVLKKIVSRILSQEFNGQINNIVGSASEIAKITLEIKKEKISVEFQDNKVINITNPINIDHSIEYLDNPFVLDSLGRTLFFRNREPIDHREKLQNSLASPIQKSEVEQVLSEASLKPILEKVNFIAQGALESSATTGDYVYRKLGQKMI